MDEINKANANNILFVAAAGNAGTNNDVTPHYPSSYNTPNMIAVAATDNNDGLASFSCFGPTSVHIGAPGVDILSLQPGNLYQYLSGTSMATPHVAGAAALVLAKNPTFTTAQVRSAILNNTDPLASLSGKCTTGGRLNLSKAVGPAAPPTPDYSLALSPTSATVTVGSSATYTVNITRTGGFTGGVTFSISGLPAGAAGSFSPNPSTTNSSTLTVTTSTSTPTGTYAFTVTGTSGTLTRTTTGTLVVQAVAAPDYSLSVTPASVTVTAGASASYTVNITRTGGFTGGVTFSISGLPAGAAGTFSPNPSTGASATLTVTTSATTPAGSYVFTVTGTSGTLSRTTTGTIVVAAGCGDQCDG
jgi:hypothetical protein